LYEILNCLYKGDKGDDDDDDDDNNNNNNNNNNLANLMKLGHFLTCSVLTIQKSIPWSSPVPPAFYMYNFQIPDTHLKLSAHRVPFK